MKKDQTKGCLLGFPDDKGVTNNKGRPGAKHGPAAFRNRFWALGGTSPAEEMMIDAGDVTIDEGDIAANHKRAIEQITQLQQTYSFSLLIGGGHDYAYPHLRGISHAYGENLSLGCINIDAHLDLRSDETGILSGSPFYMAIERGLIDGDHLVEFGIHYYCNSQHLWEYANENQVKVVPFDRLRHGKAVEEFRNALEDLSEMCDGLVISLDLDSVQAASAPGVSAPAPEGFTPSDVMEMIEMCARDEKVVSLGIYELNPTYDQDEHTAGLASIVAYNFCQLKQKSEAAYPSDKQIWQNLGAT